MARFTVTHTRDVYDTLVLTDHEQPARVTLVPSRGALVTGFSVGDRELLYLDRATLDDPTKNVRGGIPVLFPIAGRLADDQFTRDGVTYHLKQHGFARNRVWAETSRKTDPRAGASVWLSLDSDEDTRRVFPWDFHADIRFTLSPEALTLHTHVENPGASPMPLHLGFHPYFNVPDGHKPDVRIVTDARRAYDNRTKATGDFHGFDLTQPEVDLHLLDHRMSETVMHLPDAKTVTLRTDEPLGSLLVVWTLAGKDFVCVEPWTAPGNALNTGHGLRWIGPGQWFDAEWSIARP